MAISRLKPAPHCPSCKQEMKVAGTIRGGKPRKLFQCMNTQCHNHKTYNRDGEQIG